MRYWIAYLVISIVTWALMLPSVALCAVLVVAARYALPDPVAWWQTERRVRELRDRAARHPGDLLARRTLADLHLERDRPREAAAVLEEAIAKGLSDDEAFYMLGLARLRAGEPEAALEPIVKSVAANDRLLLGAPYFAAATALTAAKRYAEAEDALERGLALNSSRVDALVAQARVRAARGNTEGARQAYRAAVDTWRQLPGYLQRSFAGSYLAARWALLRRR